MAGTADNTYYVYATHIYYRGFTFQNDLQGKGTLTPPTGPLKQPALLRYDGNAKTWAKVVDLLKVTDDTSVNRSDRWGLLPAPAPQLSVG